MLKHLRSWASLGLPEEAWERFGPAIADMNVRMLCISSLLGCMALIPFALFPFFLEKSVEKTLFYLAISFISLVIFLLATQVRDGKITAYRVLPILLLVFTLLVIVFGLAISIFWQQSSAGVTFIILYVSLHSVFLVRPSKLLVVQLFEIGLFISLSVLIKPVEIYMYDTVNMLAAFVVGMVLHWSINRMRMSDLMTKQELQENQAELKDYADNLNIKVEQGIAQLEAEREGSQFYFDANPQINFVLGPDYQVLDCNSAALRFYGYEKKEDMKEDVVQRIRGAIPEKREDGSSTVSLEKRVKDTLENGEDTFDTVLLLDGEKIPFHFYLKSISYQGEPAVAVYQTDLRGVRATEKNLEERSRLLTALNSVAAHLISLDDEDASQTLWESIAMFGMSVNVSRVTIWQNFMLDGELHCTSVKEWSLGVPMQRGKAHTINIKYSETVPTWESILRSGDCINEIVKNMIPVERAQMEMQGIVSVLAVPIFIKDEFWGFVGYDDCVDE